MSFNIALEKYINRKTEGKRCLLATLFGGVNL